MSEKKERKKHRGTNGDGYMRQRKDGRWECRVMYGYRDDGKPNMVSFYGKSKNDVRNQRKAYEEKLDNGQNTKDKYTFAEFADLWFKRHKKNIEEATVENYKYILRTLKGHFGEHMLDAVTTMEVEDFLTDLRENGYSDSYVSSCRGMLTQIYNRAMAYRLVNFNPSMMAEKMKARKASEKKPSFTPFEVSRLLAELPEDRMGWSIRLMICTGMRPQEMMGLEPKHIMPNGEYLVVEQAVKRRKGTAEIGGTKNASSTRLIPIPQVAQKAAIELRKAKTKYIWEARRKDKPCNPSYFIDEFKKCLAKVEGIPILTPHSCRVTYVSIMQYLGVKMETISKLCGHTTTKVTNESYLRIHDEVIQDAVGRIDNRFGLVDLMEKETNRVRIGVS